MRTWGRHSCLPPRQPYRVEDALKDTKPGGKKMTTRILFALFIVSSFWACGGDSVTTSEPPALERGLHEVGSLTQPRYEHVATLMQNGKVLIGGGYAELLPVFAEPPPANAVIPKTKRHISAEIFDPGTGTSSPTGDMTVSRHSDHGISLRDGRVLIMPQVWSSSH